MRVGRGSVAAAVLLSLLAVLAWRNIVDIDFGLHMAGGRYLTEQGAVPTVDPFTWTIADRAYVAYHWLFQLGIHAIDAVAGIGGLVLARFALLLGVGVLLLEVLRLRRVSALAGALFGLLALLASEWRFTLRPELASWLLAAAVLLLVERRRQGGRAPLWLLPPLFVLWVNLHVFVPGLAILLLYSADECLARRSLRSPLLAWTLASFLAMFLNPYGVEGVLYPLTLAARFGGEDVFAQHIDELVSPFALTPDPMRPFTTGIGLQSYRLLLLVGLVAAIGHALARRWLDCAVLVVFGVLAALAVRNVVLFALLGTPALCVAFDAAVAADRPAGRLRRSVELALLGSVLGFAVLLAPRVVSGGFYAEARRPDRFAAELCETCLSLETADWLAASGISGRGLNNLVLGSTLIWRDPTHPVFIDGRNEVTGEAFFREYRAAMDAERWPETIERFAPEYVALAHRGDARARRLARRIEADPDWRLVHLDGSGLVFVRVAGPNGDLPAAVLPSPVSAAERSESLSRLGTGAQSAAWWWSREPVPGASHGLGGLLLGLDRLEAAERPLLAAALDHPSFWEPQFDLGILYQRQGRPKAALRAFQAARQLFPDHPDLASLGE